MTPINLIHYPFCPPDRIGDGAHRGRNPCSTVVLSKLSRREDASGDQQHALATLVHLRSLAVSLYVRHCVRVVWMLVLGEERSATLERDAEALSTW